MEKDAERTAWGQRRHGGREWETIRFEALLGHFRDSAHSKGLGTNKRTPRARSRKRKDAGHANSYLMESPRSMPGELVLACSGKTSFDESEFKFSWTNINQNCTLSSLREIFSQKYINLLQNITLDKNQSKRKIVVPMEHIFITDTFISTFSKLDFFKEELPFSSRAKGAPNLFNLSISSCVVHSIFTWVERTKRERRVVQPSSRVIICIPSSARPRASRRAPWPWGERARVLHNFTNRAYNRRCKTRLRFERISISFSKWRGKGGTWPATSRKDLFFLLARIERPLLHRNFARC